MILKILALLTFLLGIALQFNDMYMEGMLNIILGWVMLIKADQAVSS